MDTRLLTWARAVKARQGRGLPALWLFSDAARMPDLFAAVARLPRGLGGVVFRHDAAPDRAALALEVARLCRARRLALVVAGDWRLARAVGAGVHWRGGRGQRRGLRRGALVTSSAHNARELRRAGRLGVDAVFLSPVFPTASHPGAAWLGVVRWALLAHSARPAVLALGGVSGATVARLPRFCAGIGAIGGLANPDFVSSSCW
jgi:thiamine-phosphate pyrophosphorylase